MHRKGLPAMSLQIVCRDLQEAVACLRGGHALIFPTETFYGLGCLACDAVAVNRIYQLKRRPVHKPLPLLAASEEQVCSVACLEAMPESLRAFAHHAGALPRTFQRSQQLRVQIGHGAYG